MDSTKSTFHRTQNIKIQNSNFSFTQTDQNNLINVKNKNNLISENQTTNLSEDKNFSDNFKPYVSKSNINISHKPKQIAKHSVIQKNLKTDQKKIPNEIKKFENIYSPRTTFLLQKNDEEKLCQELSMSFDPIAIKIMKNYFKERLGVLNKNEFIGLLKKNLVTWCPEMPNRENKLIILLTKIFEDIDINDNNKVTWEEFTNYIINSSDNKEMKKNYGLKHFEQSKKNIDDSEFTDIISHAFYILKYNLIGIVIEGKSKIHFYDAETCKKLKTIIDIKETQQNIDIMTFMELDKKAKESYLKKEEELKIKKRNYFNLRKLKNKNYNLLFNTESLNNVINLKTESILKTNSNPKNIHKVPNIFKPSIKKDEIVNKDLLKYTKEHFSRHKKDFNKKLTILCTLFIPEYDLLFVSSSNNKISAWKYNEKEFKNVNKKEVDENSYKNTFHCAVFDADLPQNAMEWDEHRKFLYSGQPNGKILAWEMNNSKNIDSETLDLLKVKEQYEKENKINKNYNDNEKKTDNYKFNIDLENYQKLTMFNEMRSNLNKIKIIRDNVSCLKIITKMDLLAAGYYNGNIILWDTISRKPRKYYSDQKTGIYQIDYDPNKNLIFSCGFDHDIYIYDPYVDGRYVNKLIGHNYSINSIAFLKQENELISIDIYGNIKVWDLNNYYNYQTINLNKILNLVEIQNNQSQHKKKISSNQKMIYISKSKKIFTYGDNLMMFNMINTKLIDLCDTQLVLGCFYNPDKFLFYTICLKKIKIWSILNGKIKTIYENYLKLPNSETTSFCVDKTKKKLYIGDSLGNILCINLYTGEILKEFSHHNSEIIALCHSTKHKLLISLGNENLVKIHEDKDLTEIAILKELTFDDCQLFKIKLNEKYSRLILGSTVGELKFYDLEHLRQELSISYTNLNKSKLYKEDKITEIYFFEEYPLCIIFYESSTAKFEITPPNFLKFKKFGEFKNKVIKDEKEYYVKIISSDFDKKNNRLFTGDYFGYVHFYDLSKIISTMKNLNYTISPNEQNINIKNSIKFLDNYQISNIFCFEAHKEKIKQIYFPEIYPTIIITTGGDRHVRIFCSNTGKYLDEFKVSNESLKEYPIGIKYYFADPFVSKLDEKNPKIKNDIIYRKDIIGFKSKYMNKELLQMINDKQSIQYYLDKLTTLNARERLYLLTKKNDLPVDKSTSWKYEPDLELIKLKENEYYQKQIDEIKNIKEYDDEKKPEIFSIDSNLYQPKFINEMDENQIKDFTGSLNNKIRKVELISTQSELDSNKYKEFEIEKKRMKNISYKNEIKNLFRQSLSKTATNTFNPKSLGKTKLKIFKLSTKKCKNVNEWFESYKEDFNSKMSELENVFEYTFSRNNRSKISSNNKSFNSPKRELNFSKTSTVMRKSYQKCNIDNSLPNINNSIIENKNKNKIYSFKNNKDTKINLNCGLNKKNNLYKEKNIKSDLQ